MARPVTTYEPVERGIRRVVKTYDDGRVVTKHQIKYADSNGKIVSRTITGSASKARAELAAVRAEVQKGDHVVITKRDSRTTFKQIADHWHEHSTHMRSNTRAGHKRMIEGRLKPLHEVTMRGLTYQRLQEFQSGLAHLAPATQKQTMWVVQAICADAVKRGLLRSNPALELAKVKARRSRVSMPSHKEVEALISRLRSPHEEDPWSKDSRWALLVETAAYTGMRAGELCGLQVRDFRLFERSVTVARSIPTPGRVVAAPKSDAGLRTVDDLDVGLCKRLAVLADGKRQTDYLFGWVDADGTSRPYNHLNFYRRMFQPACEALGLDCRFHDLRHFHASLLIEAGLDPVKVAHRLGHSTPSFTLNTYAHLFETKSTGLGERIAAKRAEARGEKPRQRKRKKPF